MRLPPWAIEALRNGMVDVVRKANDAETIARVKEQAAELFRELPETASRGFDSILRSAAETARGAVDQGRETLYRWADRQTEIAVPAVNVSGNLYGPHGTGVGVSDFVLQVGCDLIRGDCDHENLRPRLAQRLSKVLASDGHTVAVAANLDAAVASLVSLATDRDMVIHRSQAIRLPSGLPLPEALGHARLRECGGVQVIEPDDFAEIDRACVVLADDGVHPVQPVDFSGRDVITVAITPIASIQPTIDSIPSAVSLLRDGIDLVVLAGGPANGGVDAGILVGKTALVETIKNDRRWRWLAASDAVHAMTLASMTDPQPPVLKTLIETGEPNLRSRAERMATRLTVQESIATCQITDAPARLIRGGRWEFPSRQLRLRHRSLAAADWAARLRQADPSVIAGVDDNDLIVDLRWCPPSVDAVVSESMTCHPPRTETSSDPEVVNPTS
ncbi:hypothetical protein [Roseiconus nitratireducens]|nr:hypothetical protein [Roseiconus nitratireducens]